MLSPEKLEAYLKETIKCKGVLSAIINKLPTEVEATNPELMDNTGFSAQPDEEAEEVERGGLLCCIKVQPKVVE